MLLHRPTGKQRILDRPARIRRLLICVLIVLKVFERSRISSFNRPSPRVQSPSTSRKRSTVSCSVIVQHFFSSEIVIKKPLSVYGTSNLLRQGNSALTDNDFNPVTKKSKSSTKPVDADSKPLELARSTCSTPIPSFFEAAMHYEKYSVLGILEKLNVNIFKVSTVGLYAIPCQQATPCWKRLSFYAASQKDPCQHIDTEDLRATNVEYKGGVCAEENIGATIHHRRITLYHASSLLRCGFVRDAWSPGSYFP